MRRSLVRRFVGMSLGVFIAAGGGRLAAQSAANRIHQEIDARTAVALAGTVNPRAQARFDLGRANPATQLRGITIYFQPSAEQKVELDARVKAQQTPGSSEYHNWLTPVEYAARFGLSGNDIAQVRSWLETEGFVVDRVSNSRTSISFSGSVGQVESTFQTEIHNYDVAGRKHFANATQLLIPTALAGIVRSVRNLDDFRPEPQVRFHRQTTAKPSFTSGGTGDHYLQPGDVSIIYDIKAAYNAGYAGTGQSIAIVGQSEISVSDIEDFQSAAGLTVKDPTLVLVPDSGSAAYSSGDEAESDLDLEYSGGIGRNATIYLVYVGDNSNYSVWDSMQYAVDTRIAPIISMTYGACEPDLSASDYSTLEGILEEGASQGQSIIVAAGDDGSAACYADVDSNTITTQDEELAVNYPASSAYVTAMGGTEFPSADVASTNTTYWESASGSDVTTSALSYIPEQVWNDDSATYGEEYGAEYALSSGGGGISTLTARPTWQTGVTGIPSGSYRLVPDISLDSSPNNAGYLYCTSDSSAWSSGQEASCNDGFRDSSSDYLTVAGGTSFAAPILAGMLSIIDEKENSTGAGLINPTLYTLAADSTTYASAFHDITSGSNKCTAGSSYCSSAGESEYAATTGYDEASGLGSVDLYNLLSAWTGGSSSSVDASVTTLSAATTTPKAGASDTITITVAAESSSVATTPTGTLTIAVDGTTETSSLALSSGSATYSFLSGTSGEHVITATYSGDSVFAGSTGTLTVDVGGSSSSSSGSFTLAATDLTVAQGSSGTSTVTVTSADSFAGTVDLTLQASGSPLETYGCYELSTNPTVSANATATATITVYTSESTCETLSDVRKGSIHSFVPGKNMAGKSEPSPFSRRALPVGAEAVLAGFLLVGLRRRRAGLWTMLSALALVAVLGTATGCGANSSSSSSTSTEVAKGTYTLTLEGTDASDSSISASTTFTLTVD